MTSTRFPCVCCGHLTLDQPPGSYLICPVCFWEDDAIQLRWTDYRGGANSPSLIEAQRTYARTGASSEQDLRHVRPPGPEEPLEPGWRPVEPAVDGIEPPSPRPDEDREPTPWPQDLTVLYWWRATYRRAGTSPSS